MNSSQITYPRSAQVPCAPELKFLALRPLLERRVLLPSRTKILLLLPLFLSDFGDLLEVCARPRALIKKMLASGFRESYIDVVELALLPSDAVMQFETI